MSTNTEEAKPLSDAELEERKTIAALHVKHGMIKADGPIARLLATIADRDATIEALKAGAKWLPANVVPERSRHSYLVSETLLLTVENEQGERHVESGRCDIDAGFWVLSKGGPARTYGYRVISYCELPAPDTAEYGEDKNTDVKS